MTPPPPDVAWSRVEGGPSAGKAMTATIVNVACLSIVVRDCFSAAIRYYTASVSQIWFVPDLLLVLAIGLLALQRGRSGLNFVVLAMLGFGCVMGMTVTGSATSVVSGLKMILPVVAGLYFGDQVQLRRRGWIIILMLYIVICAGVLYNSGVEFPWTGATFQVGDQQREVSRMWWAGAEPRVAGFGTDSTLTGLLVLMFSVFLTASTPLLFRLVLFGASIYVLKITTSKTPMLTLLLLLVLEGAGRLLATLTHRPYATIQRRFYPVVAMAATLAPFLAVLYGAVAGFGPVDVNTSSFVVRATESWIMPHLLIARDFPLGWLTGVGIGAVGYPVYFSDLSSWYFYMNTVDNFQFAVYLQFGLVGISIYLLLLYNFSLHEKSKIRYDLMFAVLVYGVTVLGFASSSYGLIAGYLLSPIGTGARLAAPGGVRDAGARGRRSRGWRWADRAGAKAGAKS